MPAVLRDPGPRRRLWVAAGLVLLVGWAGVALVTHLRHRPRPSTRIEPDTPTFDRVYLRDVEQSSYEGGAKIWSLSAAEIIHRKRKLGPLTINPVKEVEMTGVRIEVDRRGSAADESLDLPIQSILEKTLAAKELGFVSRVVVRHLDLIVLEDGQPFCTLEAGGASVGLEPALVRFSDGVTVTGRAGERLESADAEWRSADRRLVVKGGFRLRDASGLHAGRGGAFRIDPDGALASD